MQPDARLHRDDREPVPDVIVQGSMRRHRETAEGVIEAAGWQGVEVVEDAGWNEFDHLAILRSRDAAFVDADPTPAQFQACFEEATTRWTSGDHDEDYDESFAMFGDRVAHALLRTTEALGPKAVALVVTSGGPISSSTAALLAGSAGASTASYAAIWGQVNRVVVNSSLTKIVAGRRGATLVSFNEHSHLAGDRLTYR